MSARGKVADGREERAMFKDINSCFYDSKTIVGEKSLDSDFLYRIMPFVQFLSLAMGKNTLVNPSCWDDPYERLMETIVSEYIKDGKVKEEDLHHDHWYGQCWSKTKDSDGLWRSFTHNKEVRCVKIKTTKEKLRESILPHNNEDVCFSIDDIFYSKKAEKDIDNCKKEAFKEKVQEVVDIQNKFHCMHTHHDFLRAFERSLLIVKRHEFQYEDEVRLLAYHKEAMKEKSWAYDTDFKTWVEEVEFDPWTKDYEYATYEKLIKEKFDFKGKIKLSTLYKKLNTTKKSCLHVSCNTSNL